MAISDAAPIQCASSNRAHVTLLGWAAALVGCAWAAHPASFGAAWHQGRLASVYAALGEAVLSWAGATVGLRAVVRRWPSVGGLVEWPRWLERSGQPEGAAYQAAQQGATAERNPDRVRYGVRGPMEGRASRPQAHPHIPVPSVDHPGTPPDADRRPGIPQGAGDQSMAQFMRGQDPIDRAVCYATQFSDEPDAPDWLRYGFWTDLHYPMAYLLVWGGTLALLRVLGH